MKDSFNQCTHNYAKNINVEFNCILRGSMTKGKFAVILKPLHFVGILLKSNIIFYSLWQQYKKKE